MKFYLKLSSLESYRKRSISTKIHESYKIRNASFFEEKKTKNLKNNL